MSTVNEPSATTQITSLAQKNLWQRRFFVTLTVLGWLALAIAILWFVGQLIGPIILIGFAALIAYLVFPLVRLFQRLMPRILAILASLLLLLIIMSSVILLIVVAAIQQLGLLIKTFQDIFLYPERYPQLEAFLGKLNGLGVGRDQFKVSGQQVINYLQGAISGIIPFASSLFILMISTLLVATLAVYFMIDGDRVNYWLRHKTPARYRGTINLFMDELEHSLGGFVRGQVLLATIMSAIVGVGAYIIGVPYVFLLVIIVFICEFIPQIGAYISGAIGILFAITQGWQVALVYGIFVTVMQGAVDGQILAPRIIGHSVGLHPILSITALLIGTTLFGLLGAFFACPAAAIIQTFVRAFWDTWHQRHPDEFTEEEAEQQPARVVGSTGQDQPAVST